MCSLMPNCNVAITKQVDLQVVLTECLLLRMLVRPMQTWGRSPTSGGCNMRRRRCQLGLRYI